MLTTAALSAASNLALIALGRGLSRARQERLTRP